MSSEAFKPQADMKGNLTATFADQANDGAEVLFDTTNEANWAKDQGFSHQETTLEHAINYGKDRGAAKIGQHARVIESVDVSEYGEGGKEAKAKAESKKAMTHILHMQKAEKDMAELVSLMAQIEVLESQLNAAEEKLDNIDDIIASGDVDTARAFLEQQLEEGDPALQEYMDQNGIESIDDMTPEQIWEAMNEVRGETLTNIERLKLKIRDLAEQCEQKLEGMDRNDPKYKEILDQYQTKLDGIKENHKEDYEVARDEIVYHDDKTSYTLLTEDQVDLVGETQENSNEDELSNVNETYKTQELSFNL